MFKNKNNSVAAVSSIMIITFIGKILGLLRDRLLAINYGVGMESNAFLTASRIPRVFFDAIFASVIAASFIPVFNEYLELKGKKEAFKFSSNFISVTFLFLTVLTILGMIFSVPLTTLFANKFDTETTLLCGRLLKILFPTVIFTGIAFSFVGILQSFDEFNIPAAISIVSNGIVILYYIFFNDKFGIYGLAIAFLIGWIMQAVVQVPALIKTGFKFKFDFNFKTEGLKKVIVLMLPIMVSTWVQPINIMISTRFASGVFSGSGVAAIEYANSLYTIIIGVFVLSITNVIFPKLSRLNISNEKSAFSSVVSDTLRIMMYFVIPMTIGVMFLSNEIVTFMYSGKKFDDFSVLITSKALFFFALGMAGYALQSVLSRAFFAKQEGRAPLVSGVVSILVNILLCVLLVDKMDVGGLAFASTISLTVNGILLLIPIQRKEKNIINKEFIRDFIAMIIAALIMGVILYALETFISSFVTIKGFFILVYMILAAGIGFLSYLIISYLFKVREARLVVDFIKNKRRI